MLMEFFFYVIFRVIMGILRFFPRKLCLKVGALSGWVAFTILRIRRKTVFENIRRCFPDFSEEKVYQIARSAYLQTGTAFIDFSYLSTYSVSEFRKLVDGLEGSQEAHRRLDEGKGGLFVTGHFGSWEMGTTVAVSEGVKETSIYQPLHNYFLNKYLIGMRTRRGEKVASIGFGMRAAIHALRKGEIVMILADQDAGERGIMASFFNTTVSCIPLAARLAIKTGLPFFPCFTRRTPEDRFSVKVYSPLKIPKLPVDAGKKERAKVMEEIMEQFNRILEKEICERPDQYFWFHKRWKTIDRLEAESRRSKV